VAAEAVARRLEEAVAQSRALVLPWEQVDSTAAGDPLDAVERLGLLGWRVQFQEAVRRVVEGLVPIVGADRICYVTGEAAASHLSVLAVAGRGVVPEGGDIVPADYGPAREALLFGRSLLVEGEEAALWHRAGGAAPEAAGIAAVPVVCGGRVEGALLAFRSTAGAWEGPVVPAMEMGAFFVAREVERWRAWYSAARYLAHREALHDLVRGIAAVAGGGAREGGTGPREAVYRLATDRVRRVLRAERVLFVEADEKGERGRLGWESGGAREGGAGEWVDLGDTYAAWVLKRGVHRIFSSVRTAPPRHPVLPAAWAREEDDAYLLLPVQGGRGCLGVLVCTGGAGRVFGARDAEAARDLVDVMRMGLSHALREEELQAEAARDGLTGLYNRRAFLSNLGKALHRLDGRHPAAVVMVDVDHFKRINDTYGHAAGDDVLRTVASVIRKAIRRGDMAGRYGGEEFVVFFNLADRERAFQGAERLRTMIRQARFRAGGKEFAVTASFGVACHPAHGREPAELIAKADAALYRSKAAGRDRTTVFDP